MSPEAKHRSPGSGALAAEKAPPLQPRRYTLLAADRRPYLSSTPGIYGGHRKTKIYGRLDCPAALRAVAVGGYRRHRVFFADEQTAVAAGYRPCAACLPAPYRAWKASPTPPDQQRDEPT